MKKILFLILFLALLGVIDSGYLTLEHYSQIIPPCPAHAIFIDCGKVLRSSYSVVFGIPLALLGVVQYALLALNTILTILTNRKIWKYYLLVFSALGALASVYFMYLQLVVLRSICLYCTFSALISFTIFGLAQYSLKKEKPELFVIIHGFIYQKIVKHILFLIDSEVIHELLTSTGEILGNIGFMRKTTSFFLRIQSPALKQVVARISFPNPVGLAAGFDYDAKLTQILPSLDFGFGSVGTITNLPYEGNPSPRLGRLPKSKSLMVNKGFKNFGAKTISDKLKKYNFKIPLGISIGRTNQGKPKDTSDGGRLNPPAGGGSHDSFEVEESIKDIVSAFAIFEKSKITNSYYELNISCPNLIGNISFYPSNNLDRLLTAIDRLQIKKPVFIKMPIEKNDKETLLMLDVIIRHKIAGVIFGNLQKNRRDPSLNQEEVHKFTVGNFSGKPTEKRSNELIKLAYRKYGKRLIIIGCGGIFCAEDAYRKIKLGATLVQLITGMIYQGPQLIAQINIGLIKLLEKDGFHNISEAIGKGNSGAL